MFNSAIKRTRTVLNPVEFQWQIMLEPNWVLPTSDTKPVCNSNGHFPVCSSVI